MRMRLTRLLTALAVTGATAGAAATSAGARPVESVTTGRDVCAHGTRAVWHVAYETFGSVRFRNLNGSIDHQASPGAGRPDAGLHAALQSTADTFGQASRCNIGLRFDVFWAPHHDLRVDQEPYFRLRPSLLPLPTPAPGGPRREPQFFARYDSVMEQFSATRGNGTPLLGYDFEGETYGYVSLIDAVTPDASVLQYELLQGMSRFFTTRGARVAPNPETGIDAYCSALKKLGYTDLHYNTSITCTSDRYAHDLIAGTVPIYRGITHRLWRTCSVSRSWRRHHTLPAGLPEGRGVSSGAGPS